MITKSPKNHTDTTEKLGFFRINHIKNHYSYTAIHRSDIVQ